MNKEELIAKFKETYREVLTPIHRETLENMKRYDLPVIAEDGQVNKPGIVVFNEGDKDNEYALCSSLKEPHPWPEIVNSVIDTAIADGKFKKAVVTEINNEQEFAIITVYKIGTLSITAIVKEQRYIYDDGKSVVIVGYSE